VILFHFTWYKTLLRITPRTKTDAESGIGNIGKQVSSMTGCWVRSKTRRPHNHRRERLEIRARSAE
jgi:hypothetical protein